MTANAMGIPVGSDDGIPDLTEDYQQFLANHRERMNAAKDQKQVNDNRTTSAMPDSDNLPTAVLNYITGQIEYR